MTPAVQIHDALPGIEHADLLGARFMLCDDWMLESERTGHVTVVNSASSRRLKLSRPVYHFLLLFLSPCRVDEVAPATTGRRGVSLVRDLLRQGLLVDADASPISRSPKLRTTTACTFCNCPRYEPETSPHFAILGVPYDLGGGLECRSAPSVIRTTSLEFPYGLHFESRQPRGWHDANAGERILEGAALADAGDVHIEYGESQRNLFERIGNALESVCRIGTIPVVLGGDRSISYALTYYLQGRGALSVVQLAPTPATLAGSVDGPVTPETVGAHVTNLPNVDRLISIGGLREGEDCIAGPKQLVVGAASALQRLRSGTLTGDLGTAANVHLSIDLSVIQREHLLDSDGTPRDLALHELKQLVRAIGAVRRIVGIDLLGLDTQSDSLMVSRVTACHLALAAMSAAYRELR